MWTSCGCGRAGSNIVHKLVVAGRRGTGLHHQERGPRPSFSLRVLSTAAATATAASTTGGAAGAGAPNKVNNRLITYLTDVEGDAAYLNRYVENSRVLQFSSSVAPPSSSPPSAEKHKKYHHPPKRIDFTNDTAILIYGGDVWDKGGSDLYVIRQLLSLKDRYPDRVHFLLGNRDINKMRLWQETRCCLTDNNKGHNYGVWWRPDWKPDPSWSPSRRLQWILANTMGSPKAFEHRRQELQREANSSSSLIISDDDVLQSYMDSCHAIHGEMGQYLSQGQLALSFGQLLVVHGALPWMANTTTTTTTRNHSPQGQLRDYHLSMPWLSPDEQQQNDGISPSEWIHALNNFSSSQLKQWRLHFDDPTTDGAAWATVGGFDSPNTPYAGLMQYGMGWLPNSKERIPTVVYSSWVQNGMPRQFFNDDEPNHHHLSLVQSRQKEQTRQFMEDANVQVILSGHQPQGDLPTPIRLDDNAANEPQKLILACDTSYSGDVQWFYNKNNQDDVVVGGRGSRAVAEVLLEQCVDTGSIETVMHHGILSNGQAFESTNLLRAEHVGRLVSVPPPDTKRPWWVKAQLNDDKLLLSTAEGYNVVNAIIPTY